MGTKPGNKVSNRQRTLRKQPHINWEGNTMKKKISIALAILLIFALTVPAMAENVVLAYKGGSLYLRKGPGTEYASNGTLHHGDYIKVISYGDIWSKVQTGNGRTGYIKNLYINDGDYDYAAGTSYYNGGYTAYTTASVNFRAGASTGTASMGTLGKGTKLTVLGENGNFYLVRNSAGTQGYVSKNYVSRSYSGSSSGSSSSSGSYGTMTVTASYVNMRAGGGLSYSVLRVLPRGTRVEVLKRGNYWTRVNYRGTIGWIKNSYLR